MIPDIIFYRKPLLNNGRRPLNNLQRPFPRRRFSNRRAGFGGGAGGGGLRNNLNRVNDGPALHKQPGPPYPGPNPRAPNKPLDPTIIHPSNQHPVYAQRPTMFTDTSNNDNVEVVYVEPVEQSTTTTTTTTTTKAPTVIVLQQNPYPYHHPPYQNSYYPNQYPSYHHPPPPPPTTTTTTTITTTTTTTTTTKKPRRRKKPKKKKKPNLWQTGAITYQNMAPDVLIDGILPPEPPNRPPGPSLASRLETNKITKRMGQLQSNVVPQIVPAPSGRRFQNRNWRMRRRLRNPNQGRFQTNQLGADPYLTGNSQINSFYNNR